MPRMTTEEAILHLRADPDNRQLVLASYLDENVEEAAARFRASEEFVATVELAVQSHCLGRVLDLGAGTGIASRAFALAGAEFIAAVEPDQSSVVGMGCLVQLTKGLQVLPVAALGDRLPVASRTFDLVYCRQVLHHIPDLGPTLAECARVLRPGGMLLAVREHVVDDDEQLAEFRAEHVVHQLSGGEGAHSVEQYAGAMIDAGLELRRVLGPWDSIINCFPDVQTTEEMARAPSVVLGRRFGVVGRFAGAVPGVRELVWRRLRRPRPGRLFTFVARKPLLAPGEPRVRNG